MSKPYGKTKPNLSELTIDDMARVSWILRAIAKYTQFPTAFRSGVSSVVVRDTYIWKAKVNAELKKRKAEQRKIARELKKQQKITREKA